MKRIFLLTLLSCTLLFAQNYVQIGTGNESIGNTPINAYWNYGWDSTIYLQSELGNAIQITAIAVNVTNGPSVPMLNQTLYLSHTTLNQWSDTNYDGTTGYTQVYNGDLDFTAGWNIIDLDTPFSYNGTDNLVLHWENNGGQYIGPPTFEKTYTPGEARSKGENSDQSFPNYAGPAWNLESKIANIRFYWSTNSVMPADSPDPANGTGIDILNPVLSWNFGVNTTAYDLSFGTDQNNMTDLVSNSTTLNTTYQLSQLNWGTQYFWKITSYDASGSSVQSPVWSFTTAADPAIASFPYTQSFEGDLTGWTVNEWQTYANGYSGQGMQANYSHQGTAIIKTPAVQLPANQRITFWWADADSYNPTRIANHDTTYFEISTDDINWTVLDYLSEASPDTQYHMAVHDLTAYGNQTVYFRWRDVTDASLSAYGALLDEITIETNLTVGELALEVTSLDFPETVENSGITGYIRIFNTGQPVTIDGWNTTGPFSSSFTGTVIDTAIIPVTYSPTTVGTDTGSISIQTQDGYIGDDTITFTGSCYAPHTSFYEGFENGDFSPQWARVLMSEAYTDITIQNSDYDAHTGSNSCKIYTADTTMAYVMLVTPGLDNLSSHTLDFWCKSSWGQVTDSLVLGTVASPYNPETFVEYGRYPLGIDYTNVTFDFPASDHKFIAFRHAQTGTTGYGIYLDDISWEGAGLPAEPIIAYPQLDSGDIRIDWETNEMLGAFEWASGGGNPEGFYFSLGTTPNADELVLAYDTGSSTEYVSNFQFVYGTTYYWRVDAYNASGTTTGTVNMFTIMSDPTVTIDAANSFSTSFENVDQGDYPLGWKVVNANGDLADWECIVNSAMGQNAHSGEKAMHIGFGSQSAHDDWLISPPLSLSSGSICTFDFWYGAVTYQQTSAEKMDFCFGTSPNPDDLGILWSDNNINIDGYQNQSIDIPISEDGIYFVAFRATSDPYQFILLLDDLTISATQTGISENVSGLKEGLNGNYPNPFNPETTIKYSLSKDHHTKIAVYNMKGQLVNNLIDNMVSKGSHEVKWNGKDSNGKNVSSGVYYIKMKSEKTHTQKVILLK